MPLPRMRHHFNSLKRDARQSLPVDGGHEGFPLYPYFLHLKTSQIHSFLDVLTSPLSLAN